MENKNKQADNHIDYFAPKILMGIVFILSLVLVVSSSLLWDSQNSLQKDLSVALTPVHELSRPAAKITIPPDPPDWKTYTNSQYGFSFKYPADTKVTTSAYDTTVPAGLSINVDGPFLYYELLNLLSLNSVQKIENYPCDAGPCYTSITSKEWLRDKSILERSTTLGKVDCEIATFDEYDCERVKINGQLFLKRFNPALPMDRIVYKGYITYHDNLRYEFSVSNHEALLSRAQFDELEKTDDELLLRNQILSTFKFTNSTSGDCLSRGDCMLNNQ